jgi:hypothetical protein
MLGENRRMQGAAVDGLEITEKMAFVADTTVRSTIAIQPAYTVRSTFGDGYQCRPRPAQDLLQP